MIIKASDNGTIKTCNAPDEKTITVSEASPTITTEKNTRYVCGEVTSLSFTTCASDGTGGTIYIPKVLYDELGTVSSLDYKAATNWSTIDSYDTITLMQIEGSQYETKYADGTPITTS